MSDINNDIAEIEASAAELQASSDVLEAEGGTLLGQLQNDFASNDKEFLSLLGDITQINEADEE